LRPAVEVDRHALVLCLSEGFVMCFSDTLMMGAGEAFTMCIRQAFRSDCRIYDRSAMRDGGRPLLHAMGGRASSAFACPCRVRLGAWGVGHLQHRKLRFAELPRRFCKHLHASISLEVHALNRGVLSVYMEQSVFQI
jgi:hypothetical protein